MKKQKRTIHTTPDEVLAQNSDATISSLNAIKESIDDKSVNMQGFSTVIQHQQKTNDGIGQTNTELNNLKEYIDNPTGVVRKLDEIKSSSLITNKVLKDIKDKPEPERPNLKEAFAPILKLAEILVGEAKGDTVVGPPGPKGDSIKGDNGKDGVDGVDGVDGKNGKDGKDGVNGSDGKDGINGKDGKNGNDGSPDTPDETVAKVNNSKLTIKPQRVEGLLGFMNSVDQLTNYPKGKEGGGGYAYRIKTNGTDQAHVTTINFEGATYDGNGLVTVTGGGSSGVSEIIAVSDETTDLTIGTSKVTFRMPYAVTLTAVRASVNTAPTDATIIVDINVTGTGTILSTKLSIDATEKTSVTAASAAVLSTTSLADDAEITIDIDQVGSTIAGKGLKIALIGTRT